MSIHNHSDQTNPSNVRTTESGQILCSNLYCGSRSRWYANRNTTRVAAEVVVNMRGYGQTVLAPCANCRRVFRQQEGRGSYDYRHLTFTGIAPVPGFDFQSALNAVRQRDSLAQAEAERARREVIERNRDGMLRSYWSATEVQTPTLTTADEYGRRYVSVPMLRLTPGQVDSFIHMLQELAVSLRETVPHPPVAVEVLDEAGQELPIRIRRPEPLDITSIPFIQLSNV